jgi:Mg-chelatase subunit ChlD
MGLAIGEGDGAVTNALSPDNACLSEVREAERVDVDLFIMLDRSGSMSLKTGNVTKWDAVTSALTSFLQNPDTASMGVGLRVFPQLNEGAPSECFDNSECGTHGPCSIPGVCPDGTQCTSDTGCVHPNNPNLTGYCANDARVACDPGTTCSRGRGECLLLECTSGFCHDDPTYGCVRGTTCIDQNNNNLGLCEPLSGYCLNGDSCQTTAYSTPDVPITLGNTRNGLITNALQANAPTGLTPTQPALQGAIDYARSWSNQHPARVAAVVLATDGFPSECVADVNDPVGPVLQVAQAGATATQPVLTYVVGVFSTQEGQQGASNILNAMAQAGGTSTAYLVDTNGDVSADFLTALQNIRSSAISCDFALPADPQLDYGAVNLLLTKDDGTKVQLANVDTVNGCATNDSVGWYYVTGDAGVPSKISVCPGVCTQFANVGGGRVDLQIGCQTIIR